MTIEITQTDYFYSEGEKYEVSENTRWGCYMVNSDKSLIRIHHAKVIKPGRKSYYTPGLTQKTHT